MNRQFPLLTIILLGAFLLGGATRTAAQDIDWTKFDPKKMDRREAARLIELYDQHITDVLKKVTGDAREIKSLIIKGNKITTVVYNYGNITRPNTLYNTADLVWKGLGYGFEFTPLVGAEVVDADGRTVHILDDGMWLSGQGDYSSGGLKWGWLPKTGYAAPLPNQDIAAWSHRSDVLGDLTRKPHSWPESWYNPVLGRYVWPAFLGNDATSPDEEVYFVDDDYTNAEFKYFPFPDDSTKRGLGLDLEVRFFQFNNPLAEDIIFCVYRVTNRSPKTLDRVYFGMYGDPHIGGGNTDFGDDLAYFIPPRGELADPYPQRARSMVFAWDNDSKGEAGIVPGYFGFKFLESPTNSTNGIDDDDDGIIDESPFNDAGIYIDGVNIPLTTGIADTHKYVEVYGQIRPRWSGDENGDWNPEKDDVGIDGLPGTGDFGEGNGKPDVGYDKDGNITAEPRFGIRDVNESDQIGLTSFWALPYGGGNFPVDDELFWGYLSSDSIAIDQELFSTEGDNIFLYGSGPFKLEPGGTQRFSIALMMGDNLDDLLLNSETAQRILEANYQFAQPPPKPNVRAVAEDGKVRLYWDNIAESAVDPLTAQGDFEGYKIYRSEDYTFADVYRVTDANGSPFLGVPLKGADGKAAQFDVVNQYSGLHPIEYPGRGVKYQLGSNTGLVHEYVDSTVTNGKTYYYAIASYDHGFDSLGIQLPPTESQIAITKDPVTGVLTFDVNTLAITPGPPPSGSVPVSNTGALTPERVQGISTGDITVRVLDNYLVQDGAKYKILFTKEDSSALVYDVETENPYSESITANDTFFVPLRYRNIIETDFTLKDAGGAVVEPSRYYLDAASGRLRGTAPGSLPKDALFTAVYRYHPVFASTRLNNEDDNPVFDGMRIFVKDDPVGIDSLGSGWKGTTLATLNDVVQKPIGLSSVAFRAAPIDLEIRWNRTDTTANGKWLYPGDTLFNNNNRRVVVCPFRIVNVTDTSSIRVVIDRALTDSIWKPGREIIVLTPRKYQSTTSPQKMVGVYYTYPTSGDSILPTEGDVYLVASTKPFAAGDEYQFTTRAVSFDPGTASNALDRIYVVPNPYVAYSDFEGPGADPTLRGDRQLQFRNLPPRCTIRIFTMTGELVSTIEKDDNTSIARWNLLSYEGQQLAYGVYIYHVDVPGVGQKTGRLALIK